MYCDVVMLMCVSCVVVMGVCGMCVLYVCINYKCMCCDWLLFGVGYVYMCGLFFVRMLFNVM